MVVPNNIIQVVAALLVLRITCVVPAVDTMTLGSASGQGSGQEDLSAETCTGILYEGELCRKELLNLQTCISRDFQSEQILILLQDPVSSDHGPVFLQSVIDLVGASDECIEAGLPWVCLWYFGLCDTSGIAYRASSSYCEVLRTGVCDDELRILADLFPDLSCDPNQRRLNSDNSSDNCFLQTTQVNTETIIPLSIIIPVSVLVTAFVILGITVAAISIGVVRHRRSTICLSKEEQKAIDNLNYDGDHAEVDYYEIESSDRYTDSQRILNNVHTSLPFPYEETQIANKADYNILEQEGFEPDSSDASYENSSSDSDSYVQQVTNEIEGHYEVQPEYWHPASEQNELKIQLTRLKFPVISEADVDIQEQLGSGQFGTVHHGVWHRSNSEDSSVSDVQVAVKSMNVGASDEERVKFLQEAIIMGQFNNPQVLRILGIIAKDDNFKIMMELMENGDLRFHLQTLKPGPGQPVPSELGPKLLSYSRQVACGLIYFCVKNFIHRDLAARNILVSACGMCKIADFGLSRDLHNEDYYTSHGGKIPVRWTAPEALAYRKYSTKSDMWSFGCILYEIWSLGCKPFHNVPNVEVVKELENGYRLPPPPGCPRQVYHTMIKCWHPVPESRPTAGAAVAALSHPDFQIFDWSAKDIANNSEEARTLGAPIEEGHTLYKDLQRSYRRLEGSRKRSKKHDLQKI